MILKTAANYNDEGGYIEAWKNSDGTTEVKLIPKSGGDEGKQGLESITISPNITTNPPISTHFPIYYDDLTESEKQQGKIVECGNAVFDTSATYTATVTPTEEFYAAYVSVDPPVIGNKGEPIEAELAYDGDTLSGNFVFVSTLDEDDPDVKRFRVIFHIDYQE